MAKRTKEQDANYLLYLEAQQRKQNKVFALKKTKPIPKVTKANKVAQKPLKQEQQRSKRKQYGTPNNKIKRFDPNQKFCESTLPDNYRGQSD